MIKRVSFLGMTKEEWNEQRRKTIGGSDAGTVVGLNQFDSPYNLWAIKTGRVVPDDISDKESVRLGHDLEDYVARRWMEKTGKKLRRDNSFVYNTEYPFAHVQADRLVVNENAGFEAKTSSSYDVIKLLRDGKYRDSWYVQCVHGMMVTGADRWYLGVLCFGYGFFDFVIERSEAEIDALARSERVFWDYVCTNSPPPIDGAESTTEALRAIYRDSVPGTSVDLSLVGAAVETYTALSRQIAELEQLRTEQENRIKDFMQTAEKGTYGNTTVSWKSSARKTFDKAAYEAAHGKIEDKYYKTTDSRSFRVTVKKGA